MRIALSSALGLLFLAGCGGERDAPLAVSVDEKQVLSDAAEMISSATPAPDEDPEPPTPQPTETFNPND